MRCSTAGRLSFVAPGSPPRGKPRAQRFRANLDQRALLGIDAIGPKTAGETGKVELTRFRGHPNICVQGVRDGEDETTLHPGIPSPDG